jgi:AcrR family transcriptional regulator
MDPVSAQNRRGDTALKILAAARDVFSERGFAGTTVDEIARRAGVNKATLYYQIGDKQTLYAGVILDVMGSAADTTASEIQNATSPEEKLRTYIRNVAEAMDRNPWMPPIMLREMAAGGRNFPETVVLGLARIFTILGEIIAEGVRRGVFVPAPPPLIHLMIVGAFAFFKTSAPLRERQAGLGGDWPAGEDRVSGTVATEVERLVLRALRKTPGEAG